jgi:hypothetical protein
MGAGLGLDVACLTDGRFSGGCVAILRDDRVKPSFTGLTVSVLGMLFQRLKSVAPSPLCKMAT